MAFDYTILRVADSCPSMPGIGVRLIVALCNIVYMLWAFFFFDSNKLWSICDRGADDATVTAVTKRVNGGTIGLADRIKQFKEYYNLLK